jgi:non-homologous end joining protein Ku
MSQLQRRPRTAVCKSIQEAIRKEDMVAIRKVVFTSREHIIALEARGKGSLGVTLRYPYEVRKEHDYFYDIPDEKIPKDSCKKAYEHKLQEERRAKLRHFAFLAPATETNYWAGLSE